MAESCVRKLGLCFPPTGLESCYTEIKTGTLGWESLGGLLTHPSSDKAPVPPKSDSWHQSRSAGTSLDLVSRWYQATVSQPKKVDGLSTTRLLVMNQAALLHLPPPMRAFDTAKHPFPSMTDNLWKGGRWSWMAWRRDRNEPSVLLQ